MIEWKSGMATNDPAGDLSHVTLTLPTPPLTMPYSSHRQVSSTTSQYPDRTIRPFPARRVPSSAGPRTISITMAEPDHHQTHQPYTAGAQLMGFNYHQQTHSQPMYGENEVPVSVHFSNGIATNGNSSATGTSSGNALFTPGTGTIVPGEQSSISWSGVRGFERSPTSIATGEGMIKPAIAEEDGASDDEGSDDGDQHGN